LRTFAQYSASLIKTPLLGFFFMMLPPL
jgi:hypothetical protein